MPRSTWTNSRLPWLPSSHEPGPMSAWSPAGAQIHGASTLAHTLRGAFGFAVVSVGAFSVWAFAGRWFRGHGGEGALYAAIAGVFIALTGLLLHPLVRGERRLLRFYAAFAPAFLVYAVVWSGFWFWLGSGAGEWFGSLLGSVTFVAILAWRIGNWTAVGRATGAFFVLHTLGYLTGGQAMALLVGLAKRTPPPVLAAPDLLTLAKLSWGLFYGLGFGAGLGYVLALLQPDRSAVPDFTPQPPSKTVQDHP